MAKKAKSKQFCERLGRYLDHAESGMNDFDAKELSRYENDLFPKKCDQCGAGPDDFEWGSGMVGEDVVWCRKCHGVLWENTVQAVRMVL